MKVRAGMFAILVMLALTSMAFGYERQVLLEIFTSST
jgi:hypothetical protein